MEMNKEETGKERMKTKRKEGIKRAASQPSQRQEVIYLMYLWAIFLTSAHNTISVRCLRKTKCTRKFVNKKEKATNLFPPLSRT